ncbi:MAG: VOC family protein [Phycisphaerae bacterium]|nr:VOC family protein [Gemmatimonadaceae bacterium]
MNTSRAPFTIAPSRYQLPVAVELGAVTLQVADLERSLEYYQRVVGLRVLSRGDGHAALGAESGHKALVHLVEKRGVRPVPPRGLLGLYHFAILLPSRVALGQFLAHLGRVGERAGMSDHLVSEALYLTDPDGLGIEVYADRARESWQMDGLAIAMATDPLDVRGLVAAGGASVWSGAPAGTRIGHVHLYVGTLEEAASFYHEGVGFDRVNVQFHGALFMSAGGYHHHLGTNIWAAKSPVATGDDARLLEWTVVLPVQADVEGVAQSVQAVGYKGAFDSSGHAEDFVATDPWGTAVRITARLQDQTD